MATKSIVFASSDHSLSDYFVKGLKRLGFEVRLCRNAEEVTQAFDASAGQIPDMLMTDGFLFLGKGAPAAGTDASLDSDARVAIYMDVGVAVYKELRPAHPTLQIVIFASEGKTLEDLCKIDDPRLVVISLYDMDWADKIIRSTARLCPQSATKPGKK